MASKSSGGIHVSIRYLVSVPFVVSSYIHLHEHVRQELISLLLVRRQTFPAEGFQ